MDSEDGAETVGDLAERRLPFGRGEDDRHEVVLGARRALDRGERRLDGGAAAPRTVLRQALAAVALEVGVDLEDRRLGPVALGETVDPDDDGVPRLDALLPAVRRLVDLALGEAPVKTTRERKP